MEPSRALGRMHIGSAAGYVQLFEMPENAELRDEDLLRRLAAGEEDAFRAFYGRHQKSVYRFALHMTGRPDGAEEVVQEAFLTLMREARKFDPSRGSPQAFLFGIARNHVRRFVEAQSRFVALATDENGEYMQEHASELVSSHVSSNGEEITQNLVREEIVQRVRRAVLALPAHYREAVALCDLQGRDYAAAARMLDCPIGTIRSRLARARDMLAEKLRPTAPPAKKAAVHTKGM